MGGARVLVVEDESTIRRVVTRVLGRQGYEVRDAETVGDALAELRGGTSFDLVLSDVRLPDGDGHEIAKAAAMLAPPVRVLLMSGYSASNDEPDEPPMVRKPFTPAELLAAVARALA